MLIFLCQLFYFSVYRIVMLWYNVCRLGGVSMYLHVANTKKGKYLTFYESYRDKVTKKPKNKCVQAIGYLDEFTDLYEDPIAHFKQVAKDLTDEKKNKKTATITIDMGESMTTHTDDIKNVGYLVLKQIYKELEIDKFWKQVSKKYEFEYDLNKIFQLLVFSRIIFPASKKKTFEARNLFFEPFEGFQLEDVYRALDIFSENDKNLQQWLYDHSCTKYNRDMSVSYFDCTNYYWDVSKPDRDEYDDDGSLILVRYRKMGPEKNNRKDPIVELGLLLDKTCIPLAYELFPGNDSEKLHLLPIVKRAKRDYGFNRTICVADRGLNTSDNIFYLNGNNKSDDNHLDGYVYGQSVRGADAEFKKWVIDQNGYIDTVIENESDDAGVFRHKSRIYPKKLQVHVEVDGKKVRKTITADQKQMVYYSKKYAKKQKEARNKIIEKANDLIKHPGKYDKVAASGTSGYVINLNYDDNGVIINKDLKLDVDRIAEEEKYDGYYSIVTSELKMSDTEIRNIYRGLIKIEDTFKVTKSELDTRPIHVRTNEHIEGHFTTCFTALVLIRLLESRLGNKYPTHKVIESLRKYQCAHMDKNHYQFFYYDEILKDIEKSFEIDLSKKYKTTNEIRRLLKY